MRILFLCACLAAPLALAQQMYKWVDDKGVTHYSESAPPEGTKGVAKVEVKTTTPDKPPVDNWREHEQQAKEARTKQAIAEEARRQQEERGRAGKCSAAQRRADSLKNRGRIYSLNEKGERVYLEDKERAAQLEDANQEIASYCR